MAINIFQSIAQKIKNNKKSKVIAIVVAVIGGLSIVGAFVLYASPSFMSAIFGMKLKEYQGPSFSIQVPENYSQKGSGGSLTFTKYKVFSDEDKKYYNSGVSIGSAGTVGKSEADNFETAKALYRAVKSDGKKVDVAGRNVYRKNSSSEETTYSGHKALRYKADIYAAEKDGAPIGVSKGLMVAVDGAIYNIDVISYDGSADLKYSADKILNSLSIK